MKTPKGTELPILKLRGKEYLEVKYRIVWFCEERPEWSIQTEIVSIDDSSALFKATILDQTGRTIATSHKFENAKGFPDFIEKAETGAIGRALALCGFGTQFTADDLDEGERIVDSPVSGQSTQTQAARTQARPTNQTAAPARVAQMKRHKPKCPKCSRLMMESKVNKDTWYCMPCKHSMPMGAAQ